MYKKIFSAILFGALTIASTSTFVSCKDYDDDINNLQAQIDELNQQKLVTINNSIDALKKADTDLQKAITDGDAATLAAAQTLIAEAISDCQEACKTNLATSQAAQDAKFDEAITKVNQRVDDIVKLLSDQDGNIQQVGKDLKALSDKLATFEAQYGNLTTAFTDLTQRVTNLEDAVKAQKASLEEQKKALDDLAAKLSGKPGSNGYDDTALKNDIKGAQTRIDGIEKSVKDLQDELTKKFNELTEKLNNVSGDLNDLKQAHIDFATQVNNQLTELTNNVNNVKAQAEKTAEELGALDVMFKILVNDLRGLVYMPKLYIDGIETIEYPYLKYNRLSESPAPAITRKEADDDIDITIKDLKDYIAPTPDSVAYGPVWPIQYHMNPGNASTEYANIKGYYAYEAEVLTRAFYDTKANAAGTWGIVPADRWVNQYENNAPSNMIWSKKNGIMTVGLQITKPEGIDNPGMPGINHFPTDLSEDTNDDKSPESVKNVILALQANSKKAVADYAAAGKDTVITSDYAQLVMEKVKIEGIIWNKNPGYWNSQNTRIKDFWEKKKGYGILNDFDGCTTGPYNYRTGDGSAKNGRDEAGVLCGKWVHVWDEPDEALLHPADIELYIDQEVNLSQYLGVHWYFEQNEPLTQNVTSHKSMQTWKFDAEELRRYGFVWVFDTVDYYVDTNKTHDSRYMRFTDHRLGKLVSADITEVGATYESETHTSVGREPLVRVRLFHFSDINDMTKWQNLNTSNEPNKDIDAFNALKAKCVLDGYIRLHITRPELLPIEYPTESFTFDLCNGNSTQKYGRTNYWDYAMFNARVLKGALNNMEKEQFDAAYRVELADPNAPQAPTGENRDVEVAQYIQFGAPIAESPNEYYKYTNVTGVYNKPIEQCQIGKIYTEENVDGVSNHTYWWKIPADTLELLTHHAPGDNGSAPVTITRWIHYTGHFYSSTHPNNNAATYDDIFIKLTLTIKRADVPTSEVSKKDENYWYNWEGSWAPFWKNKSADRLQSIANNTPYPEDGLGNTSRTVPWRNEILANWDGNKVNIKTTGTSTTTAASKFYFAPFEYEITALDGTVYIVTPRRGSGDNIYNKFICKYWNEQHTYQLNQSDPFDSAKLLENNKILNQCAIKYGPDEIGAGFDASEYPQLDGVFSNDTLYAIAKSAYNTAQEYEPIAMIDNRTSGTGAGQVILFHEYEENKWIAQQPHGGAVGKDHQPSGAKWNETDPTLKENAIAEACVNAVGYVTDIKRDANDLMTGEFEDKGNPLNKQLRSYIGVIATSKCNIANQMKDKKHDSYDFNNFTVFQMSWERPINILSRNDVVIDAQTNADYIYLVDLIKLFDWRGVNEGHMWGQTPNYWGRTDWKRHQWLWAYYNVKNIIVDLSPNKVLTNLSSSGTNGSDWSNPQTMDKVSNMVQLRGLNDRRDEIPYGPFGTIDSNFPLRTSPYDFNAVSENEKLIEYMGLDNAEQETLDLEKARFGYIKYYNNGQNVHDFEVKVPVTVVYDWGKIIPYDEYREDVNPNDEKGYLLIHIHYTRGNN